MALNRKQRRDTAIKGKTYYGEIKHPLMLAELRVYVNKEMPRGVMIVSAGEGERLKELIDDASDKDTKKAIADHAEELEREANEPKTVSVDDINKLILQVEAEGAKVNRDEYAIYALDLVTFDGELADYPLDVVRVVREAMPDDAYVMVTKRVAEPTN